MILLNLSGLVLFGIPNIIFLLWWVFDLLSILFGGFRDKDGYRL